MAVTKSILTKQEIEDFFSQYKLGNVISSTLFDTGWVQTNILVKTDKGKFVLRIYEQGRPRESVLFELNLLKYLKLKNYPCSLPFKNINGKIISFYQNKPVVVFEYLEGIHIEKPDKEQKIQLVRRVAELQNITQKYTPSYKNDRFNYGKEFCKMYAGKEAKRINTENSFKKLQWYFKELSNLKLPVTHPKTICHCDFHFSNVLFKDNKFNALIDFDDANYTYSTFDLISLFESETFTFDHESWKKLDQKENVFDFSEAIFYIREYQRVRKLSNIEKKHLFDVLKLGILIDCLWYFERGKAESFFERKKIEYLEELGSDNFYNEILGVSKE